MSEFDDEIKAFLDDAVASEADFAASDEAFAENDSVWSGELAQALVERGFTVMDVPESEDVFGVGVSVTSTPSSTEELPDAVRRSWSAFIVSLHICRGFMEYGASSDDYVDPSVLEAAQGAVEVILANTDIPVEDLQAAIGVSSSFLGDQVTQAASRELLLEAGQDLAVDPQLEMKRTLAQTALANRNEQSGYNLDLVGSLRPEVRKMLSGILPIEHDDFNHLLRTVETLAKLQCDPEYAEAIEDTEGLVQELTELLTRLSGGIIDRHGLNAEEIVTSSIAVAVVYKAFGYVPQD